MAHTGERAVAGRQTGRIGPGEMVTWEARHLGRTWTLTSRITTFEPSSSFVDEQVSGPFHSFRHEHRFESLEGGTLMTDDWRHVPPFGPVGRLADRFVLDRYVRRLLQTRNATVKREAESGV